MAQEFCKTNRIATDKIGCPVEEKKEDFELHDE